MHSVVNVNLLGCSRSEYRCGTGLCINSYMKCDGKYDCPDKTDEFDCGILTYSSLSSLIAATSSKTFVVSMYHLQVKKFMTCTVHLVNNLE